MNKQTLLLSALALSVGLSLSALPPAAASLPTQVPGQGALPSLAPMLEKVLPAVVSVQVEGTASPAQNMPEELKKYFGDNAPQEQAQPFEGLGSGVIIDAAKGYVLTNNHVINQAQKISVQLNDGREFDAKLVGSDEQSDIALLQLLKPSNLTQIAIADSDKLRVGDFAVAVGNPFGLGQTATSGIISALGRSGLNLEGLENFIQTDASINRGNSGGALLNLNGELIGINTAILAPGGGSVGIGFAIPSNMAKILSQQLIQFGEIKRGPAGHQRHGNERGYRQSDESRRPARRLRQRSAAKFRVGQSGHQIWRRYHQPERQAAQQLRRTALPHRHDRAGDQGETGAPARRKARRS